MERMNYNRLFAGGLVAGVVFVIADALFPLVFSASAEAWLAAHNLTAPAGGAIAAGVLVALLIGVVAVWLYAAIRPRYGAGPSTAAIAGLAVWGLLIALPSFSMATLGSPVDSGFWFYLVWWLVFAIGGTMAGARMYHEVGAAAPAAAPAMDD